MTRTGFAGAKVNLYLHVGPPGPDGYHPIDSLMVFADVGDTLTLEPASEWRFTADGPFSAAAPMDEANLAARAARAVVEAAGAAERFHVRLNKHLPVAAGIGGGSADAAAVLRLVNAALGDPLDNGALQALAARLGSDVPACVAGAPVVAQGRGERLSPAPPLPEIHAVLVNPGAPSPTGPIFAAYDRLPSPRGSLKPAMPSGFSGMPALAAWLRAETRNDLEPAARQLTPAAGEAVDTLARSSLALLARMSGSGATAFALCADAPAAVALAAEVSAQHPRWWVRPSRLGAAL